jgi:hypothetical protein
MTEGSGAPGAPHEFTDLGLAWIGAHLVELRRDVSEPRLLYQALAVAFVVGLAAHVGGYLLKLAATTPPLGLGADLLYTLGWALWTGAVVVVFVQIWPEAKRRQIKRALDAYEALPEARRRQIARELYEALHWDEARAGTPPASGDAGAPEAS